MRNTGEYANVARSLFSIPLAVHICRCRCRCCLKYNSACSPATHHERAPGRAFCSAGPTLRNFLLFHRLPKNKIKNEGGTKKKKKKEENEDAFRRAPDGGGGGVQCSSAPRARLLRDASPQPLTRADKLGMAVSDSAYVRRAAHARIARPPRAGPKEKERKSPFLRPPFLAQEFLEKRARETRAYAEQKAEFKCVGSHRVQQ